MAYAFSRLCNKAKPIGVPNQTYDAHHFTL
jgi:hypothetical protein